MTSGNSEAKTRGEPWIRAAALIALAVLSLVLFRSIGPLMIDDSWISFRYAANLAGGDGLVFNPGERVQGFTSPLYALLLALGAAAGAGIPSLALAVGFMGALGTAAAFVFYRPGTRGTIAGSVAAAGLLLLPEFLLNSLSGMETSLFCALLAWSFVAWRHRRFRTAGILQGLLLITRPDAVFWIAPVLIHMLRRDRPALWRTIVPLVLIAAPWFAFAWIYYGNPVPHSIAAKRLIHAGEFGGILAAYGRYFGAGLALGAATMVALGGVALAWRPFRRPAGSDSGHGSEAVVPLVASVLYLSGLVASGVLPFEAPRYFLWYAIPPIAVIFLLAVDGAERIAERIDGAKGAMAAVATLLILTIAAGWAHVGMVRSELPAIRDHFEQREGLYQRTAAEIRRRAGDRTVGVLVGEVGMLGYRLLGHRVYDSSGINSPEILRLRREDRDELAAVGDTPLSALRGGTPRWVLRFIEAYRPEFITSQRGYVHVKALERYEPFRARYEPIAVDSVWLGEGNSQNTLWQLRDGPVGAPVEP